MALVGDLVLLLASDAELLAEILGGHAHVVVVHGVPQAVPHHGVVHLVGGHAHTVAAATVLQHPRGARHVLHAADQVDVAVAGLDGVGRHGHRRGAGDADAVHGDRRHFDGDTGLQLGLASGVLPQAGLDDVAEDDFFELLALDSGAVERLFHDQGAQVDRRGLGEAAHEAALRGAYRRENNDVVVRHCVLLVPLRVGPQPPPRDSRSASRHFD